MQLLRAVVMGFLCFLALVVHATTPPSSPAQPSGILFLDPPFSYRLGEMFELHLHRQAANGYVIHFSSVNPLALFITKVNQTRTFILIPEIGVAYVVCAFMLSELLIDQSKELVFTDAELLIRKINESDNCIPITRYGI